ncbi:MAG TPA: DUF6109 family natural product biosynthesis protein [Solirubrobacteraceae bacterium]|nr:DUF6109 family natural product biosynthesis protein [Solirubrobacteraceae bacterium]
MARPDPEAERRKRAEEDLTKALRRGDLDLALASLEKLRRNLPPTALDKVGPIFRRAVADAHRTSQWARLQALAVREAGIPGLPAASGGPGEADACRWALLWGCVRSRDFPRARSLAEALAPGLHAHPALARCLEEILDREGAISDDLLAALPESIRRAPDPRLGHDPPPVRPEAPRAPATAEAAHEAVLLAAHRLTWAGLADLLGRWIAQASPAVASAIRKTALRVARREILSRFRDGAPLGPAARVVVSVVGPAPRAPEEIGALLESMRLGACKGGAAFDLDRDPDGVGLLARALLPEPAFGPAGARWLAAAATPAGPARDRLYAAIVESHPSDFALWALVCRRVIDPDGDAPRPPGCGRAWSGACATGPRSRAGGPRSRPARFAR